MSRSNSPRTRPSWRVDCSAEPGSRCSDRARPRLQHDSRSRSVSRRFASSARSVGLASPCAASSVRLGRPALGPVFLPVLLAVGALLLCILHAVRPILRAVLHPIAAFLGEVFTVIHPVLTRILPRVVVVVPRVVVHVAATVPSIGTVVIVVVHGGANRDAGGEPNQTRRNRFCGVVVVLLDDHGPGVGPACTRLRSCIAARRRPADSRAR